MPPVTLASLTDYHRQKVLDRAHAWRMKNHDRVMALTRGHAEKREPDGATLFDPSRWSAENWNWFRDFVVARAVRRAR